MLQNQNPVRRWKQWLVLPVLGALPLIGSHAASAQPVPAGKPVLSEAAKKARHEELGRKLREALHQDSLRTGGKFEPGTKQQFTVTNINKPGEIVVTVTRVKQNQLDGKITRDAVFKEETDSSIGAEPKVYTNAEQMPQLPSGGGMLDLVQAIQRKIVYPKAQAGKTLPDGRIFARFVVAADGTVQDATIVKGLSPAFDDAVLAAIKQLPHLVPGKRNGQAVAIAFTVPIEFKAKL